MDTQIFFDDNLLHPETNSNIVLHNGSKLNSFLNGLVSTDNMPTFMQQFLMSSDYVAANQALHTTPVTYFDHAFNTWTVTDAPSLSNGVCTFDGDDSLQCTPGWTIGGSDGDFTIACLVTPQFTGGNNPIFSAFNTSGSNPFFQLQYNSSYHISWNYNNGSAPYPIENSSSISANTPIHVELSWDSSDNTRRLFINGSLAASETRAMVSFKTFRIARNYAGNGYFKGSIDYLHISDFVRHSSDFTPTTPEFDDHTLSLLLFD